MVYQILRDDSLNVSATFGTKAEALAALRRAMTAEGRSALEGIALIRKLANGDLVDVASDEGLAQLALNHPDPRASRPRTKRVAA